MTVDWAIHHLYRSHLDMAPGTASHGKLQLDHTGYTIASHLSRKPLLPSDLGVELHTTDGSHWHHSVQHTDFEKGMVCQGILERKKI